MMGSAGWMARHGGNHLLVFNNSECGKFLLENSVSHLCSRQPRGDTLFMVMQPAHSNASRWVLI